MSKYKVLVEREMNLSKRLQFEKISRLDNKVADQLTKLASLIETS